MSVGENKYVALTTFTKDGRRKNCPVWIVDLGERQVGFTTESTSWKEPSYNLTFMDSTGKPAKGPFSIAFLKPFSTAGMNSLGILPPTI